MAPDDCRQELTIDAATDELMKRIYRTLSESDRHLTVEEIEERVAPPSTAGQKAAADRETLLSQATETLVPVKAVEGRPAYRARSRVDTEEWRVAA